MKEEHRAGKHDECTDFNEHRHTSNRYFVSNCPSFCSSKVTLALACMILSGVNFWCFQKLFEPETSEDSDM